MSRKIIIEPNPEGNDFKLELIGVFQFQETALLLGNVVLHMMQQFLEAVPEVHQEQTKEIIYNSMNEHFSSILESFAPEYELRPDLTVEAIMRAEDEIMSEMQDPTPAE